MTSYSDIWPPKQSTLSDADRALYTTRLTDAQNAMHQLRTGQVARVFVDQNGERIEYMATSAAGLRAYIIELQTALGLSTGIVGPMTPWML